MRRVCAMASMIVIQHADPARRFTNPPPPPHSLPAFAAGPRRPQRLAFVGRFERQKGLDMYWKRSSTTTRLQTTSPSGWPAVMCAG